MQSPRRSVVPFLLVLVGFYAEFVAGQGVPAAPNPDKAFIDMTEKRLNMACSVQMSSKDTEKFVGCFNEEGKKEDLYQILDLASKCSCNEYKLNNFDDLYANLCKDTKNVGKISECLIEKMKEMKMDLTRVPEKAMVVAQKCADKMSAEKRG